MEKCSNNNGMANISSDSSHQEDILQGELTLSKAVTPSTELSEEDFNKYFSKNNLPPNPELDNFLCRVDEISQIIHGLASDNPSVQEKALKQADILIHDEIGTGDRIQDIEEDGSSVAYKVKSDRTVINKCSDEGTGEGDMSQVAFMKMVEKDAAERAANRRESKEKSDEFRKAGNVAFRKQIYPEALDNFNKAIALVKYSPCLYNNRALTYLRIGIYTQAIEDCDKAIHLSEGSIKAHLLKAKAYFLKQEPQKCKDWLDETREKFPNNIDMIDEYQKELFEMRFLEIEMLKVKRADKKDEHPFYDPDLLWKKAARHEILSNPEGRETQSEEEKSHDEDDSN